MDHLALNFGRISEFDALAQSISARLGCRTSLISMVQGAVLFALGHSDCPVDPSARRSCARDVPCGRTIAAGKPLRVADVQSDAGLGALRSLRDMNVGAYMGVPLRIDEGRIVGAICAMSTSARIWQDSELDYLMAVGDLAESKLERHLLRYEHKALSAALAENDAILSTLSQMRGKGLTIHNADGDLVFVTSAMDTDLHLSTQDMLALPCVARQLRHAGAQSGAVPVVLPVPTRTALRVQVSAADNGLMLAEWSRAPSD